MATPILSARIESMISAKLDAKLATLDTVLDTKLDALIADAINSAFAIAATPQRVPVIPAQDIHVEHKSPSKNETLTCENCGKSWTRTVKRGQKPKQCPNCASIDKQPTPIVEYAETGAEIALEPGCACQAHVSDGHKCDGDGHYALANGDLGHCRICNGKGTMDESDIARYAKFVWDAEKDGYRKVAKA